MASDPVASSLLSTVTSKLSATTLNGILFIGIGFFLLVGTVQWVIPALTPQTHEELAELRAEVSGIKEMTRALARLQCLQASDDQLRLSGLRAYCGVE